MAYAPSLQSSLALQCLSAPHTKRLLVGHDGPNLPLPLPRPAFARSVLTFSRRRNNNSAITSSSSKKKKQSLLHNNVEEDDDLDEDAFEALFNLLEEDLKNDDQSTDDGDDEISEEDLARLERDLAEAFGDDELLGALEATEDNKSDNEAEEDDDDDEERPVKLKNWQFRRLAYALKNGRRKISIKNLAADLCLDRAIVLELLRDPPPNLLLMSAALPDKPVSTILEPETKPMETISLNTSADVAKPEAKVDVPVHVMQSRWSAQKRLKKVQVETLERVYKRTKRPTNAMISSIVHVTNLPRKRVVKWFEDKRAEDGVPDHRLPYQRRQGSSGLIWEDRFFSGDLNQMKHKQERNKEFGEMRKCQSAGSTGMMEHSRSNGGPPNRTCVVSTAADPPSPKVSGCGFCGLGNLK